MINNEMLLRQIIEVKGRQLLVDLIVFNMPNFDMILEMDFLGRYKAEIDYWRKKFQFSLEDGDQFDFGEGCIKSIKVRKKC